MANKGRQNNTDFADDNTTSITNQNIAGKVCDLLDDDENVKKRVRKCVFLCSTSYLILGALIVGFAIGTFFGNNYELRGTAERLLEESYSAVPKDA